MNNKIRNQSNSIILLYVRSICNLAFCLKTRNQRARKQFGIHNSQELTNLNVLRGQRSVAISSTNPISQWSGDW